MPIFPGPIPFSGTAADIYGPMKIAAGERTAAHTQYKVNVRYEWASGKIQLPVGLTGQTQPACFIPDVNGPFAVKIVTWIASRVAAKPVLPNPNPTDSNLTLLSAVIETQDPDFGIDKVNPQYTVAGTYVYAMTIPWIPGQALDGAVSPLYTLQAQDTSIDQNQFVDGII